MSEFSDSDSDSSDIEHMFRKARNNPRTKPASLDDQGEGESSDDAGVEIHSHRKKSKPTVEEKLASLNRERSEQDQRRHLSNRTLGSDDEDDADDGDEKVDHVNLPQRNDINGKTSNIEIIEVLDETDEQQQTSTAHAHKDVTILLDDSSDEDESNPIVLTKSVEDLERQGVKDQAALAALQQAQEALSSIRKAQHESQVEESFLDHSVTHQIGLDHHKRIMHRLSQKGQPQQSQEGIDLAMLYNLQQEFFASSTKTRPTTQKRTNTGGTLRLKIRATYSRQGIAERTEDTILEKVNEQDTFHTVAKQFLHQVGLHPSTTTVFFRLNGKAVQSTRTPAAYGLSNLLFVVLEASVLLSTFVTPPASATPKANVGPMLRLILRCAAHEGSKGDSHMFKLGAKECFGVLKERYLERLGLSSTNSTIRLCFDGEILTDQQTPGSLDMENEDLIDVRVIAL
jgi:hypothetical protein